MKNEENGSHWVDLPEGYTISENDVDIDLLFNRLMQYGVWDKKRADMLLPVIDHIKDIWRVLLEHPDLFRLVTCQNEDGSKWSHHMICRVTQKGSLLQCLMANCHEAPTPMVTYVLDKCKGSAVTTWYLPATGDEKPGFSERMMGMRARDRIHKNVSDKLCDTVEHHYMFVEPDYTTSSRSQVAVEPVSDCNYAEFLEFIQHNAGEIYVKTEGFDGGDSYLLELNEEFRSIGMSRRRHMYLAYIKGSSTPMAALVANTGPFAMNLRFLEKRSELFVSGDLPKAHLADLCGELIKAASAHYEPVEPGFIPIVTKEYGAEGLKHHGARLHTLYHQHLAVPENELLVDYHLNLLRLRYEKMKKMMQQ